MVNSEQGQRELAGTALFREAWNCEDMRLVYSGMARVGLTFFAGWCIFIPLALILSYLSDFQKWEWYLAALLASLFALAQTLAVGLLQIACKYRTKKALTAFLAFTTAALVGALQFTYLLWHVLRVKAEWRLLPPHPSEVYAWHGPDYGELMRDIISSTGSYHVRAGGKLHLACCPVNDHQSKRSPPRVVAH